MPIKRCKAMTKAKHRCRNHAVLGHEYCRVHSLAHQSGGDFRIMSKTDTAVTLRKQSGKPHEISRADFNAINWFVHLVFPNMRIRGNYIAYESVKSLEVLNAGSFGLGSSFTDDEGNEYVIKFIHPHLLLKSSKPDYDAILSELNVTRAITAFDRTHPSVSESVIKTYGTFKVHGGRRVWPADLLDDQVLALIPPDLPIVGLIQEKGDIVFSDTIATYEPRITPLDWVACIVYYIRELARGVQYFERLGYVHSDIKPDNIIIKVDNASTVGFPYKYQPKFIDFGLVHKMERDGVAPFTGAGTPLFMSPELGNSRVTTSKADVFASGLSILIHFDLITYEDIKDHHGRFRFDHIVEKIKASPMMKLLNREASPFYTELGELLVSLINPSLKERVTPTEMFNRADRYLRYLKANYQDYPIFAPEDVVSPIVASAAKPAISVAKPAIRSVKPVVSVAKPAIRSVKPAAKPTVIAPGEESPWDRKQ